MPQYMMSGDSPSGQGGGYQVHSNGHSEGVSPNSSQLSMEGREGTLVTRTQKQHVSHNVTTTTKTIREVQYIGPDGQPIDYIPDNGQFAYDPHGHISDYQNHQLGDYGMYGVQYQDYNRPPTPPTPSERSSSPPPSHRVPDYLRQSQQQAGAQLGQGGGGGGAGLRSGYEELDTTLMPPRPGADPYARNSPSPGGGQHPGYTVPGLPSQSPSRQGVPQARTSVSQMPGRVSVTDSHHGDHHDLGYAVHDGLYAQYEPQYGHYDPNVTGSVFEDSGGMVTPLPGSLGSPGPHQPPHQAPRAVFDEDEQEPPPQAASNMFLNRQQPDTLTGSNAMPGVQWRDPDLHEVIEFLQNPNSVIKANAAAYLQHLCYMDDPVKTKTRQLGGIPPLVGLLSHDIPEIHRNACGALRNLSYGRQNDENKRAIKVAGGTNALVRLLRKTQDNEVKELVTGVLWNLSSCDDLKKTIIDEALSMLVNIVIIPHSGWERSGQSGETSWSTVFRNASGVLRNVSSAGEFARRKLRECDGLVDSLIYLVRSAIERANIDNKSVENAVCVLRNLSYRAQEIEDKDYDKRQLPVGESRAGAKPTSDNSGCFGASKNKNNQAKSNGSTNGSSRNGGANTGMDLLWQPEVVQPYLNLLSNCSNPETLEAAAGGIQNLSACYWQPSIDIRAAVRKEKGLPILVELLRMEVDRVVCAVATALRNLAIDQRNKELIGKYAMRDLVQKLPSGNPQRDHGTSDDTIAAVLATLNEVIKKHPEFSRSLLEAGGVDRLMNVTRQRSKYSSRVVKFASQVLFSMWQHQELRDVYRKAGWKEADFVTKTVAARNARPHSPTHLNSTLNRPMASQGGTRYEDRTMGRGASAGHNNHNQPNHSSHNYSADSVPMENLSLYNSVGGPGAGGRMYPAGQHMVRPGEPVYAQVNRDKKRSRGGEMGGGGDYGEHGQHWVVQNSNGALLDGQGGHHQPPQGGDSWV